jgi:hypothetical protein
MDKFPLSGVITFCVNESFEGVIPKGTPYVQIIPIKRTGGICPRFLWIYT